MTPRCRHLDTINDVDPSDGGCHECLQTGDPWLHLRLCQQCGHVGCCDDSPNQHASAHARELSHPIVRSFEPGEDWYWCYPDDLLFELDVPPGPSHS